jgi:hypothetical protein
MEINRFKQLLESTMGNIKPLIMEQTEKIVSLKQLKKMGYDYPMGSAPPKGDLIDTEISSVGKTITSASTSLMTLVRQKSIPSTNNDGMIFNKTLDNGNVEVRWVLFKK